MTYQPGPPAEQPSVPPQQPSATPASNPFAGAPRSDLLRDGLAVVLLIVALFYTWDFDDTAASRWWVDVATFIALAGLLVPYLGYAGVLGTAWQTGHNRLVRLVGALPYVASLLVLLVVDIIKSDGLAGDEGGFYGDGGVGRAAHIGIFAIILALQPRARERQRAGGEDTIWFGLTVGLLGLAAIAIVGSSIPTIDDVDGAAVAFYVLTILAAVAVVALLAVGVLRRDAAWVNVVVGLGVALLVIDVLDIQGLGSFGLFGIPNFGVETSHFQFYGTIFLIAAASAALAPGVGALVGSRSRGGVLRRTAAWALLTLAVIALVQAFYLLILIIEANDIGGDTSVGLIFALILSLLIAAVTAVGAILGLRQTGPKMLAIAAGAYALLSFILAIVSASSDYLEASASTWITPLIVAAVIALLAVGPERAKDLLNRTTQTLGAPAGQAPAAQASPGAASPAENQWTAPAPAAPTAPAPAAEAVPAPAHEPASNQWAAATPAVDPVGAPAFVQPPVDEPAPAPESSAPSDSAPDSPASAAGQNWGSFAPATGTPSADEPAPQAPAAPAHEPTTVQPRLDEWQLRALDPSTTAAELAHLAEHHPHTRPAVAGHPQAYPGLLAWLGEFGDPEIDAAIRARTS
ncbi:MAG: hypothetical protein JWP31_2016 [Aeromicrobium sp.]|nr:hypothetical protein [Aeromicrobium sp.]